MEVQQLKQEKVLLAANLEQLGGELEQVAANFFPPACLLIIIRLKRLELWKKMKHQGMC